MTTREVVLDGGSPWGFRLHGGADVNQPLRISRVNPGSKAALRGVREGDFITSINGQSTKDVSNAEAHALLKNSGDTLKLGLNEDCSGSPKRRQFKTVHQETHSETVKRSSTTSYSLTSSKIISQTGDINDTGPSTKVNGTNQHTSVTNGDRNVPTSQRSTLSSTSSSSPPSTYTETGTTPQHPIEDLLAMSDNVTSSRSRRRRSRNQRKKAAKNAAVTIETIDENKQEAITQEYRVESPPKLNEAKTKKSPAPGPVKSKSLDDDELVKIQELSETSETEDKPQSTAIVTEVESDPDLIDDQPMISPEEELTLRNFLESLNLTSAPPPEIVPTEKSPSENQKARKAQNRVAIEQYFTPIAQNPRFLDVISEETSDLSDREQIPKHHPTPELEIPKNSPRAKRRRRFKQPVDNPAVLLDTKIVEVPKLSHATVTCATPSEAEIVFLSDSESPEESWHDTHQGDITEKNEHEKEHELTEEKHESELPEKKHERELPEEKHKSGVIEERLGGEESDVTEEKHEIVFSVKKNGIVVEEGGKVEASFEVLTPPPTPDSASPKNETSTRAMYDPKKSEVLEDDNLFVGIPREILVMCTSGYASKEDRKDDSFKSKDNNSFDAKTKWFADFFKQDSTVSFEQIKEDRFEEECFTKILRSSNENALEINKSEVISQFVNNSDVKRSEEKRKESGVGDKKNEGIKADCFKVTENCEKSSKITKVISTSEQRNKVIKTCTLKNNEPVRNGKINTAAFENTKLCELDLNQNKKFYHSQIDKHKGEPQADLNTNLKNKADDARIAEENLNDLTGRSDEEALKNVDKIDNSTNMLDITIQSEIKGDKEMDVSLKTEDLMNSLESQDDVIDSVVKCSKDSKMVGKNCKNEKVHKDIDNCEGITDILNILIHSEISDDEKPEKDAKDKNHLILPTRLLPSPTPSVSSEGSSSRGSSLSTVRYIPMNSSIGDVTSLTVPENPGSLRQLCLDYLLSLPFGADVIQELADVALSIQALTDNLADKAFTKDFLPDMPSASAKWVGVPTERDPRLVMCLSPTQKDQLEKTRKIDCEADKLLDLHEKFIFRQQAGKPRPQVDNLEIKFRGNDNSNDSRLLAIIRDEPQPVNKHQEDFLYYVAKGGTAMSAATLPSTARLRAKDLNEWLQLARSDEAANKPASRPGNRRQSLPQELYAKQMEYLLAKEREIQRELENLEEEKRKLIEGSPVRQFRPDDYHISRKGDYAETKNRPVSMPAVPSEFFRQAMYEEYMDKVMEREERKQLKVIKVTTPQGNYEKRHSIGIEDEFMDKVKQKHKLGKLDFDVEEQQRKQDEYEVSEPVLVMDGDSLKGTRNLPKHLQEFIDMAKLMDENNVVAPEEEYGGGVWSPGQKQEPFKFQEPKTNQEQNNTITSNNKDEPISPVWTPKSATSSPTAERKEFRPVKFESPVLGRKNYERVPENTSKEAPRRAPEKTSSETGIVLSSTLQKRLPTSHSSPASGFNDYTAPRLPRAQNPTITLLQKAREGQLPKAGALYIEPEQSYNKWLQHERPASVGHGEIRYKIKNDYTSESDSERPPRKMADMGPRKFDAVGPTTRDGMPLILRSEVKDANQSKWYKKMYDTIHKQKPHRDEYVTVRYKQRRGQYPYASGYLSEPEPGAYDSDYAEYKYATLDRRRLPIRDKENTMSSTMPRNFDNKFTAPVPDEVVKLAHDAYKNQPGRIENYIPGHSSISEKEAKEWWDEVMDIFDGHLEQQKRVPQPKSFINQALKESGYESDSTLVFRRRDDLTAQQQLSPLEQKEAYKVIQAGGDIPLHGLRKLAPERPKDDPELEYFPISPTLTRIRIHKNIKPQTEFLCYPVTVHYPTKRSTASPNIPKPPPLPPSPPRRRSSRNNSTLRLVSTMKVKSTEKLPVCKRHETCFTTTSNIDNTNVKYLRDKLTYKLSPTMKPKDPKNTKPKVKVTTRTSPEIRSKIVVETAPKTSPQKCNCSTRIHSTVSLKRPCKCKTSPSTKPETKTFRTFGTEKRKFDLSPIPKVEKRCILVNSPELLSPNEVKKAQGTVYKKSTAVLASAKNSASTALRDISIPIKVGMTEKAKTVLKSTVKKKRSPPQSSVESLLQSPTTKKKVISSIARNTTPKVISRTKSSSSLDSKKLKKSRKEQINGEIAKNSLPKQLAKPKCAGKASGTEMVKKLREMEDFGSNSTLADIQHQRDLIQSDHFFQHLFLRDVASPTPSIQNSWLLEKAYQLQRQRKPSISEPSINAMKVYLQHTRPVSESKFRSLEYPRSRSASPKSVTFERNVPSPQRSSSLPPKLVFSQTSRPVSPKIERKYKPPTPPLSPRVIRSPSSRRIMYLRHNAQPVESVHKSESPSPRGSRLDLFCPSLSRSNSSLDSYYDRKEYQAYVRELLHSSKRSAKFRDLNDFYATIEKFGQLEQTASSLSLKPRGRFEEEIIDYDRWKEVRARERAERELKSLVLQLKEDQKEKGFLFRSRDVDSHKWRRECDRGLRVKEKSVENIKEEFEKIEREEPEEISKRQFLDTYKPLWRGTSVLNLANRMVERRSQSEGRVASARQKLIDSERMLTHGIGSRLWSSLSMEQVNILKKQLSEIYTNDTVPKLKGEETVAEYAIQVPNGTAYRPALTVRRNSDSSEYSYRMDKGMSESDKKILSQTLSREVLDHISKRKDTALPLVLAKETRGAVAAADANIKVNIAPRSTREEPKKALVKTNALNVKPVSETESASTDESCKTVIYMDAKDEIKKKVEYFEHAKKDDYCPTVYKPAESHYDNDPNDQAWKRKPITSHSYQDLKELFGETELTKFATIPLSATRKPEYVFPERPPLRALRLPSPPISEANSYDSFYRSRSLSPFYWDEPLALVKAGEVRRLKSKFEYDSGTYPPRILFRPRRWRSDPNLNKHNQICVPGQSSGDVGLLRSKYEYPAHSGRGRSRLRRGGVVSPTFLRAEDRFMPHINIISKMANLYGRKSPSTGEKSTSTEDLARILGCPVGEVEKLRQKFDNFGKNISLLGHMFTSSPNIKELRDIAPYLTASWIAHRYPKSEDNTRSLSSPDYSSRGRDTSLVRRDHPRPKSTSPPRKSSILRTTTERKKFDAKVQPLYRYQPEPVRYNWTSTHSVRPSVSFQEPEPPVPPPKGQHGVRSQEPESPRKYLENEVTIHYKTPVRQEIKEYLSEDELAYRQAEAMKKIYQEERRRKYLQVSKSLQELQDMNNRRHTDNFIPSQKSPIPLNRYDDFEELTPAPPNKPRPRSPEPRLLARALYNFVGQTARELTFRKGDLIYVRRQVDKNWYEGELNAMVGLFPVNYVEIVTYDVAKSTPRKSYEGQARAKFNFVAQTHLELSLAKGELVVVTRRVDDNWFEGKIGGRKGIFPVSYVDLLIDPGDPPPPSSKPVASPAAHSLLLNGSAGGKDSMGSHSYLPNISSQVTTSYHAKPVQVTTPGTAGAGSNYGSLNRSSRNPVSEALHIETQSEPIPYRALYKYLPQNDDELELLEGDTVYVLEKCDDGWYVGSSERTGAFGTFPGNYVEKI